jgi:hypothetical protein
MKQFAIPFLLDFSVPFIHPNIQILAYLMHRGRR